MDIYDIGIYLSYGLVIIAVLAAVILPLINAFNDPQKLVKTGIAVAVLLVIFFIGYTLADNEVTLTYQKFGINEGSSKLIGGALITMYVFFVVAFLSIIVTEVGKLFK